MGHSDDPEGGRRQLANSEAAPDELSDLGTRSWSEVFKGTVREFQNDNLFDWAAALTYYAVLSLFPAMLALVSLLSLFGEQAIQPLVDNVEELAPEDVAAILTTTLEDLQEVQGAGLAFFGSLAVALWSASGYVAAFMRASNVVYDIPEGRPFWITLPVRVGVTLVLVVLVAVSAIAAVFTGGLAQQAAGVLGVGDVAVQIWDIAKWPVIVLIVVLILAILYWSAPNVRQPGFRWISPGSGLAVLLWLVASGGFAVYVANFGDYNATYGVLAGAVIFLIWLWISNLAVLLGVEFDSELLRRRAVTAGQHPEAEPYAEPRSTRAFKEDEP